MSKNWVAINVGLLALAALLAWQLELAVNRFKAGNDLGKLPGTASARPRIQNDMGLPQPQPPRRYNAADFGIIPAQNLFSDIRGRPDEESKPTVAEAPPLAVKPVLVGVTLSGTQRLVSIIDPSTPPAAGAPRRTQTRRLGDVYQGYAIVDIMENQMVLENGARREIIPLFDSTKQRSGGAKTTILASRVVAFGAAGAAGAAGASVTTNQIGARTQQAAATSGAAGAAPPAQSGVRPATPAAQQQTQQARQTPGNAPQQPTWNERTDEQGRRVIRTPFGDIIRDKPPND